MEWNVHDQSTRSNHEPTNERRASTIASDGMI